MKLTSPNFGHNGNIPSEFTCDGINISPELHISDVPKNAKSLVLVMDDPDAIPVAGHVWDHWVVWNISPDTKIIQKGKEPFGTQGLTSFKRTGYGGPCPPNGLHKYIFKLYALDIVLNIPEKSNKIQLESAMKNRIVEKTELAGTYLMKKFQKLIFISCQVCICSAEFQIKYKQDFKMLQSLF